MSALGWLESGYPSVRIIHDLSGPFYLETGSSGPNSGHFHGCLGTFGCICQYLGEDNHIRNTGDF